MSRSRSKAASQPAPPPELATLSLTEYVSAVIQQALSAELNYTALFLSERLCGLLPSEEASVYLLALSLLRTGNAQGVIHVLRAVVHPPSQTLDEAMTVTSRPQTRQLSTWRQEQNVMRPAMQASLRCAWVYSKACQEVGRNREAEDVLAKAMAKASSKGAIYPQDLQLPSGSGPSMASLHVTRAHFCIKAHMFDEAVQHFLSALQDSWWCWEAFEGLCALGAAPDADPLYAARPATNGTYAPVTNQTRASPSFFSPAGANLVSPAGMNLASTIPFPVLPPPRKHSFDSNGNSSFEASFLGTNMMRQASGSSSSQAASTAVGAGFFTPPSSTMPLPVPKAGAPNKRAKDAVRRSTRLTGPTHSVPAPTAPLNGMLFPFEKHKGKEPRSRVPSNPRERKRAKASSSPPPLGGSPSSPYAYTATASTNQTGSAVPDNPEEWLKSVMRKFAKAEAALSRFESGAAMEAIMSLEIEQRRSWRASIIIARARMEALDYPGADKAFAAAREAAPYVIVHSDLHSTLLWHLSRSTDLSYLAQQVMALSPLSPEAWVCTGNVFSLLDDHSNGLKCFKRAIQLVESDGRGASTRASGVLSGVNAGEYPYVMAGHECVALEEWENALGFFREAIRRRQRCYTAWFGLGNVYMKTGKLRLAEYHFNKAVVINPSNAMLVTCVGAIQEKMGKRKEALEMYEQACVLAPQSAAVHFKKAKLLVHLKKYKSALQDLLSLSALAPDEFNVQFLLGKVYGHLGNRAQMTKHFTFAQDLDPRSAQRVREAIEGIAFDSKTPDSDATMET